MQHKSRTGVMTKYFMAAAAIATLPFAGCACLEAGWDPDFNWEAGAAEFQDDPDCSIEAIEQRSKEFARLAENADPKLLDDARREAERACADKHRDRAGA